MEFIDIRQLIQTERIKNPQGIAPLMQKEDAPETFLKKLRRFIGDYRGIVISNHGFSPKSEYLVKVTKKNLQLKIIKEGASMTFLYEFEMEKLYRNNVDTSKEDLEKFMQYMKKIGTDLTEEKAYMWDIKKEES
jgi:hypothetical protein